MFISFDLKTNYIIKYLETHNKIKKKAQNWVMRNLEESIQPIYGYKILFSLQPDSQMKHCKWQYLS